MSGEPPVHVAETMDDTLVGRTSNCGSRLARRAVRGDDRQANLREFLDDRGKAFSTSVIGAHRPGTSGRFEAGYLRAELFGGTPIAAERNDRCVDQTVALELVADFDEGGFNRRRRRL